MTFNEINNQKIISILSLVIPVPALYLLMKKSGGVYVSGSAPSAGGQRACSKLGHEINPGFQIGCMIALCHYIHFPADRRI